MAKVNYFLAKDLAKVYVYMICIESRPLSKSMYTRKEGNPKYMTFVSCVLRMISRPWAFCECIGEFEKRSNLSYRFIFRESLAKVLLKPWRKTAFIWRLGGLICGLAKTSVSVEVSELADEGEQGPKYYAKRSNLNVQPPQKNYGGSFVRGPVRYSPDVPRKINMRFAKVWRK